MTNLEQRWLITVEVRMDRHFWLKENHLAMGDVASWYAQYLLKMQCPEDFRLVGAVPISEQGALDLIKVRPSRFELSASGKLGPK
jgi:hypothetical protein